VRILQAASGWENLPPNSQKLNATGVALPYDPVVRSKRRDAGYEFRR